MSFPIIISVDNHGAARDFTTPNAVIGRVESAGRDGTKGAEGIAGKIGNNMSDKRGKDGECFHNNTALTLIAQLYASQIQIPGSWCC